MRLQTPCHVSADLPFFSQQQTCTECKLCPQYQQGRVHSRCTGKCAIIANQCLLQSHARSVGILQASLLAVNSHVLQKLSHILYSELDTMFTYAWPSIGSFEYTCTNMFNNHLVSTVHFPQAGRNLASDEAGSKLSSASMPLPCLLFCQDTSNERATKELHSSRHCGPDGHVDMTQGHSSNIRCT